MEGRVWLKGNSLNGGIKFFQPPRGSNERSARSQSSNKVSNCALGLRPDLFCCAAVVGSPVGIIGILIGVEIFVRISGLKLSGLANGAVRAFQGISPDDLCAVRGEDALAFRRDICRNANGDGDAARCTDHGVSNAGVSAGGVQQSLAWGQRS